MTEKCLCCGAVLTEQEVTENPEPINRCYEKGETEDTSP